MRRKEQVELVSRHRFLRVAEEQSADPWNLAQDRNPGDRRARGVVRQAADHHCRLAVPDEHLRRCLALRNNRRVELHVVRRGVVVRLAHREVHVAVRIDDRRDRQRRTDRLILNRLHESRADDRCRLRDLHERHVLADVQDRLLVVLRDDHGERKHLHIAACLQRIDRDGVAHRAFSAGEQRDDVVSDLGLRRELERCVESAGTVHIRSAGR